MKNLILLSALLATSALADVSVKVNRVEASVIDNAEESANEVADIEAPAGPVDHNASRSNNTRSSVRPTGAPSSSPRDAASGMPSGKRQHFLDPDSDDDGLVDRADDCDDDCDSATQASPRSAESKVEVRGWDPEKKDAKEKSATRKVTIPALDGSSKD